LGVEPVERLQALVLGDFRPDLTFVLDLPVEVGLDRAAGRGGGEDRYERMDKAFHERLRLGYLDIARRHDDRCVVIDAAQSPQAVHDQIMSVVNRLE
jgi:dTMP kinase